MLLTGEVPYKHSLLGHTTRRALGAPFYLRITLPHTTSHGNARIHALDLRVPTAERAETTVQLSSVQVEGGKAGEVGHLFIELLDDREYSTGAPMPVAVLTGNALSPINITLQPAQIFRFYLVHSISVLGEGQSLFINGQIVLASCNANIRYLHRAAECAAGWSVANFAFHSLDEERQQVSTVNEEGCGVPQLIYAQVEGGEDES